jgi:hypothetical protein
MLLNQREVTTDRDGHTYIFRYRPGVSGEERAIQMAIIAKVNGQELNPDDGAGLLRQVREGKSSLVIQAAK